MYDVVVLTVAGPAEAGTVRAPVRACADELSAGGARVSTVTATSDQEIDEALSRLDGPARADRLAWPDPDATRLVLAIASDSQLRAVVGRMVRRWAPPASRRPADLAPGRTVPDLPPMAVLPLGPPAGRAAGDLAGQLHLPREPVAVARAVLAGRIRRLDLLRQDGGSVTLDGSLLGASDHTGRAAAWRARVEVDDEVLSAGDEPLLAGVVANAGGYTRPDGLPLVPDPDPADGLVQVAVALLGRQRWRRRVRVEVRRASGRAVTVHPAGDPVPYLDDGVPGLITHQRSWWVEPGSWAVYGSEGPGPESLRDAKPRESS